MLDKLLVEALPDSFITAHREIAQALTKRVEAQLSQAYAKLSIARREQLGGALAANR